MSATSAMASILSAAHSLYQSGAIDKVTMRDYETLRLKSMHQEESGQKRPSKLAAKLLSVVEKHGISVLD